jgi:hypothetical protein
MNQRPTMRVDDLLESFFKWVGGLSNRDAIIHILTACVISATLSEILIAIGNIFMMLAFIVTLVTGGIFLVAKAAKRPE